MHLFKNKRVFILLLLTAWLVSLLPLPARAACSCCTSSTCQCSCTEKSLPGGKIFQHQDLGPKAPCMNCRDIPVDNQPAAGSHYSSSEKDHVLSLSFQTPLRPVPSSPYAAITNHAPRTPYLPASIFLLNTSFLL
jgi:hypothetical protein